ncbi:MAG: hypothetical protein HN686_08165 [Bacteroidetes bacterium]|jgi:formate hydrogenlyase transcriptional activator|nr:hypothetical protein [Bacteroidota bacterium]
MNCLIRQFIQEKKDVEKKSTFFEDATLRICGNLEIELALDSLLLYLKDFMPVVRIFLSIFDDTLESMNIIARAEEAMSEKLDLILPLPPDALEAVKNISTDRDVFLIEKPEEFPSTRHVMKILNAPASSVVFMILRSNNKIVGNVVFHAVGEKQFAEGDMELIESLKGPMKLAMSNTLRHREVLKLKDLLADDNRYLHSELRRLAGDEIIGANFGLHDVLQKVEHVASLDSPVLLLGETGVKHIPFAIRVIQQNCLCAYYVKLALNNAYPQINLMR